MRLLVSLLLMLNIPLFSAERTEDNITDTERLGMAIDYFAGGKYHEALILFNGLDKKYNLNPRFKAYIGICYYYDWKYEEACSYLDAAIPHLEGYAPHERSIYYNTAAESHFEIKEYDKAIPLYEKQLLVCYDNEKGDALFRLGFCYMFRENWVNALDYFKSALAYYTRFPKPGTQTRLRQLENMIKGCEDKSADILQHYMPDSQTTNRHDYIK